MTMYHNYEIKEVTEEDNFLAEIKEEIHSLGSWVGFVLGDVDMMIDKFNEGKLKLETIEEFKTTLNLFMDNYFSILDSVWDEWERRGCQLSTKQQSIIKKELDRDDRAKEEYRDR